MHITERAARETGREYALRIIRENIIRLELQPGSMVSENELAQELGLSRGPVREALLELSKLKIVEIYPQRGSCIAPVDYDLIDQACFLRQTIECAVVERCCERGIPPGHLQLLEENMQLQELSLHSGSAEKKLQLDNRFHYLLFESAGVRDVYALTSGMMIHFDRVRAMSIAAAAQQDDAIVRDHSSILSAIQDGDREQAVQRMARHLNLYQIDREAIRRKYPGLIREKPEAPAT